MESNPTEDYDLGEDLGISRRRVVEALPHREMDNEQYLHTVRILNCEQKRFFYHVLHKVTTKSMPFYTFLSGGAGCGKSVLIRAINQALLKYYSHLQGEDPNTCKLLLCAPTGKAAHNIGGSTIHSAFCIPANQGFQFKPLDMQQLNTTRARYHDLKVVIIDEISMVGRGMLNYINLRLQEILGCTRPFGNVSILAVGDLYQLKPVKDAWLFSQKYKKGQLESMATNQWIGLFHLFELTEVMRQKEDQAFAHLLNRLREGRHSEEDLDLLKTRLVHTKHMTCENLKHLPHLFCKRKQAFRHNSDVLSNTPTSEVINVEAIDSVSGNVGPSLHAKILPKVPLDSSKTMGLQKNLVFGIGLPGELCLNVDTTDGLTNGASFFIRKFDFRVKDSRRCSIVWVEFDDELIGKKWRIKYHHLYQPGIPQTWTPVLETCRKFTFQFFKTYLIVRRQFPISISAGKTIHKARGSTIKAAVMHFGDIKIDHIHYVGLSRCSSLEGVHILHLNCDKISVSQAVEEEMERLRTAMKIKECLPDFRCMNNSEIKVCFQNCRSLRKHINDIKQEHNLICADVIAFSETRLSGLLATQYEIDGFSVFSSNSDQSAHGIVIYCRNSVDVHFIGFKTFFGIESGFVTLGKRIIIGFVYCPPKCSTISNFTGFLSDVVATTSEFAGEFNLSEQVNLVLMCDFNYVHSCNGSIAGLFKKKTWFKATD